MHGPFGSSLYFSAGVALRGVLPTVPFTLPVVRVPGNRFPRFRVERCSNAQDACREQRTPASRRWRAARPRMGRPPPIWKRLPTFSSSLLRLRKMRGL